MRLVKGGAVKHVQAYLSARDDRESSFHRCGGPVRLVQACLCAGTCLVSEKIEKAVSTAVEAL